MKNINKIELIMKVIVVFTALALAATFGVYKLIFPGWFSEDAAVWGAFGSYFGGVLGPIVGLASLAAVLITILLQKKLLSQQLDEFTKLHDQQATTLILTQKQLKLEEKNHKQTLNQLELQNSQYELETMHRQRDRLLKVIGFLKEQNIGFLELKIEVYNSLLAIVNIDSLRDDPGKLSELDIEIEKQKLKKELLDIRVDCSEIDNDLLTLSVDLMSPSHKTPEILEEHFLAKVAVIMQKNKDMVKKYGRKKSA